MIDHIAQQQAYVRHTRRTHVGCYYIKHRADKPGSAMCRQAKRIVSSRAVSLNGAGHLVRGRRGHRSRRTECVDRRDAALLHAHLLGCILATIGSYLTGCLYAASLGKFSKTGYTVLVIGLRQKQQKMVTQSIWKHRPYDHMPLPVKPWLQYKALFVTNRRYSTAEHLLGLSCQDQGRPWPLTKALLEYSTKQD